MVVGGLRGLMGELFTIRGSRKLCVGLGTYFRGTLGTVYMFAGGYAGEEHS